ncbi:MAG: YeeE/YedE family protein [Alkaliphilus sp.]|nr:YeeE/YedE family protein [Alkaliphilus sp.]
MKSSRIEELKRQRQTEIQPKKSQLPYLFFPVLAFFALYYYFFNTDKTYSIIWIVGILIGITMQRSRFCFVASFRDPIMIGNTSLFRAVIIGLIIATVGFGIFQYKAVGNIPNYSIDDIPGQIFPVGLNTIIGALLFGIGMVIAGGCASGTLIRIGEGHIMQVVVLLGFVIGTTLGAGHFGFWEKLFIFSSKTIYMPQYMGFLPAVTVQLAVLGILYLLAGWYDKKNNIMKL